MDLRFQRILRPIAALTLVFFAWISIEPWNYAVWAQTAENKSGPSVSQASTKSSSGKFEESLRAVKKVVEQLDKDVASGKDITLQLESLKGHKQLIESADPEIRAEFAATDKFLKEKKLPQVILDRQAKAVADYDTNYKTLKDNLASIIRLESERKNAESQNDRSLAQSKSNELKAKIKAAMDHLTTKVKEPRHQKFDPNNLPHRTAKPTNKKPRLKKEEFKNLVGHNAHSPILLAYNGDPTGLLLAQNTQDLPTAADLAETIEVQFTPDIQALAAQLDHNPVKIYNWVHNNIDFVPTYGSIQGAEMCLLTKQCNDMDTASLLIALLRTSGIAARYVAGTIQVPMDQVMNWVGGFTDPTAALGFIASGGTPVQAVTSGGKFVAAQMEHTWVEAYVDYIPSRGAVHKQGDTWVPMDAGFKQYTYSQGIGLQQTVPFDANSFLTQLESTATINQSGGYVSNVSSNYIITTMSDYGTQVGTYFSQNNPNAKFSDVFPNKQLITKNISVLPGTLPFKTITAANPVSEIPDGLRHKLSILLLDDTGSTTLISVTKALPELAAKKLSISFSPATVQDQAVLNSYLPVPHSDGTPVLTTEFPASLPGYLINLQAQVSLDDIPLATGPPVGLGSQQQLQMIFIEPSGVSDTVNNIIQAGEYSNIALDLANIPQAQIQAVQQRLQSAQAQIQANNFSAISRDQVVGDTLFTTALSYLAELDTSDFTAAKIAGVNFARLPSETQFFFSIDVKELFGVPSTVSGSGFIMDAGRLLVIPAALDGNIEKVKSFMIASGVSSSALEHEVPERQFSVFNNPQAVSAVKALKIANDQGQPIFTITQSNLANILPQLQVQVSVTQEIQDAVAAGYQVVISKNEVTVGGWTGVGYIILDPKTGSGAYRITGGFNGVVLLVIALTTILLLTVIFISATSGGALVLFGAELAGVGTVSEILVGAATLTISKLIFIALLLVEPFRDWAEENCVGISRAGTIGVAMFAGPTNPLTLLTLLIGRLCQN